MISHSTVFNFIKFGSIKTIKNHRTNKHLHYHYHKHSIFILWFLTWVFLCYHFCPNNQWLVSCAALPPDPSDVKIPRNPPQWLRLHSEHSRTKGIIKIFREGRLLTLCLFTCSWEIRITVGHTSPFPQGRVVSRQQIKSWVTVGAQQKNKQSIIQEWSNLCTAKFSQRTATDFPLSAG